MTWLSKLLHEKRASGSSAEPVELWKRIALAKVESAVRARDGKPAIDVHISLGFALLMLLVGAPFGPLGPVATLVLTLSVLLVHELPRAVLARHFGYSAAVSVNIRGAKTEVGPRALEGSVRVAFMSVGSVANLLVAAAAFALSRTQPGTWLGSASLLAAEAHLAWAIAQALPIVPFHAGRAVALRLATSHRFLHAAASLALVVLGFVYLVAGARAVSLVPLAFVAMLAAVRAVAEARAESVDTAAGIPGTWYRAEACLAKGNPWRASGLATEGLKLATSVGYRQKLWKTLTWSAIGCQDPFAAHAALGRVAVGAVDVHLVAAYLACCNRLDEAASLVEAARRLGFRSRGTTKLLIDLYYRRADVCAVRALLDVDWALLSAGDRALIQSALVSCPTGGFPRDLASPRADRPRVPPYQEDE